MTTTREQLNSNTRWIDVTQFPFNVDRFLLTSIDVQDRNERVAKNIRVLTSTFLALDVIISQRKYLNNTVSYHTISLYINIVIDFVANSPRKNRHSSAISLFAILCR